MTEMPRRLSGPSADGPRERLRRAGVKAPAATGAVFGAGWLGGAILRQTGFVFDELVVGDPDLCTKASALGGIFEVGDGGRPKARAAARWAERCGAARVTPVVRHVQGIGLGFWRWLAGKGAVVWAALDNHHAVASAARACRQAGLLLVTANMGVGPDGGGLGLVRVFPPGPEAADFDCLALGTSRARRGCLDAALPRKSAPTIATPSTAEAVAALAVRQGLMRRQDGEAYEIRWLEDDGGHLPVAERHPLPRSGRCPSGNHVAKEPVPVVRLEASSAEVTLRDVVEAAGRDGGRVALGGQDRLAARLQCARRCGAAPIETLRAASTLTDRREDLCAQCGGELVPDRWAAGHFTGLEPEVRGKALRALALPLWPVLRVEGDRGALEVEVAGDRTELLEGHDER